MCRLGVCLGVWLFRCEIVRVGMNMKCSVVVLVRSIAPHAAPDKEHGSSLALCESSKVDKRVSSSKRQAI